MAKMKNATFRQLQVFESIARNGSFTAAANELHLTQPTISVQIKKLTDVVGMPLFEQMGKKIYLTAIGKELVETCDGVFSEFKHFEMTVADIKGIKEGVLNISGVTTVEYFAPRVIGGFCKKYPGIKVSLEVINRQQVLNRIDKNLDDLYICGAISGELDVESTLFLENPLVILADVNHPLVGRKNIPISELADEQFIMREKGCGTYLALDKLIDQRGFQFRSSMELGSNEAIKQAVHSGLGISMLSLYSLTHEIESGEIAILDIEGFPYQDSWYITYPRGKKLSVVAKAFYDYLLNEGRQMTQDNLVKLKA